MEDDLFFEDYYYGIEFIESDNDDIKIVIRSSNLYNVDIHRYKNGYYFSHYLESENFMKIIRQNIKDINNQKIIDYSRYKIYIYTTKENIELLKQNQNNYYNEQQENEFQEVINEYERQIEQYETQINEYENQVNELEYRLCEFDPDSCF